MVIGFGSKRNTILLRSIDNLRARPSPSPIGIFHFYLGIKNILEYTLKTKDRYSPLIKYFHLPSIFYKQNTTLLSY